MTIATIKIKKVKHNFFSVLWLAFLIINLFFCDKVYADAKSNKPENEGYKNISQLMNVMELIREKYVDKDLVTYEKLVHNAIKGMLMGLDPFSSYMEPIFYNEMMQESNGIGYAGLGIHVSIKNGRLVIIAPLHGAPAYKAGIKPNDIVLFIDGHPTTGRPMDECVKLLKGKVGSEVKLTIFRPTENLTKELTVVREKIKPSTVKWCYIPEDKMGYVRISLFSKTTAMDLDKALCSLKEKGITALVLDLRGNPGGLLNSAVQVSSRFIKKDKLIVFIEGRNKHDRKYFNSLACEKVTEIPIAILVNGMSASAAEIVSGCLQDHKRAILVGEKTFGKGSVQSVIPLPDKGAIKLTTAKYYTPSKRIIHGHGIEPNINVPVKTSTSNKLYSQCITYPGVVMPDFAGAVRDIQLERAIEMLKGIRVFKKTNE